MMADSVCDGEEGWQFCDNNDYRSRRDKLTVIINLKRGENNKLQEKTVQLQSILCPDEAVCDVEELYYHRKGNRTDFNGYFNLFYIEKWKRYTSIYNLSLDIRLKGYHFLILVHNGKDIRRVELEAGKLKDYRILLPYGKYRDGCFWFALIGENTEKSASIASGSYITDLDSDKVRDIHIGAVICTYKREAYVERNLRQLKERILERPELDVSSRVKLYIIDNGRTLDNCREVQNLAADCAGRIVILPNKNAGGAGGFTRGMIEVLKAKEQEDFTHVLLMDDDAVFEPDAFVRIHGLAATLKEKWKDITIGGAMLREDFPYILYCAGEHWGSGPAVEDERNLDLRSYSQASGEYLTGTGHEKELYSGWWLCCYSLNTVRPDNLPLPEFIHGDDIEYGIRNLENGVLYLNGVSVWHKGFEADFSGSNVYYIRNMFITMSLHQEKHRIRSALKLIWKSLLVRIIRRRYDEAGLVYKGLEDFLRGPAWLYYQDPEKLNNQVRNMVYVLEPVEELRKKLSGEEYRSTVKQIRGYTESYSMGTVSGYWEQRGNRTLALYMSALGASLRGHGKELKVIFPLDFFGSALGSGKRIYYDTRSNKAVLLEWKVTGFLSCLWLSIKSTEKILLHFGAAARAYKRYVHKITTQKAWEEYLKI